MEFSPFNNVVKLCLQGMGMEENGNSEKAEELFMQAWNEATDDFERFLAAFYISRHQKTASGQLDWLEKALGNALKINDNTVNSALSSLYLKMAQCYENLGNTEKSEEYFALAAVCSNNISDKGPFYHGTKAELKPGDLLTPGGNSNYKAGFKMNHIYFTALVNGAGLAAALAKGDGPERVYKVEPTGKYENDPNLTDKKFPGNPTRSYRSRFPLKIIEEITDWVKPETAELDKFREKLDNNKGEIIN